MPIYVYRCAACGVDIEKRQGFFDAPLATCDACGGPLHRVLQPVGIIFKGSGFYITDSRNGTNGKNGGASGGSEGESSSSTSKSEATASGASK
ncbi:MAG TPA: FmdB family zinc ribbon protein [Chloroflexota bacterium]|jgi:putative FmdB family regulatory protein|nr:FmdB family zinc ribbon protein [Chloroflexota bacterium]